MTVESQATDVNGVVESSDNLWETVLREVGSTKAIATKKVLILGDSNSGKTGVVTQLFQASLTPQIGNGQDGGAQSMTTGMGRLNEPFAEVESAALSKHELALTYSYMDVRDEDNEETVARLGIYQLASDRITDRELLRFVLDAKSFPHAAAVIVLDWSRPWRFVKSLLRWINVLSHATEQVCCDTGGRATAANSNWTVGRATVDECRERLERFLQEYSENESPANAKTADVLLPLGSGVLSSNLGLPLVVVCTKSDTMGVLERERGFSEEDFDYVQQVLRAVCLRFGAALIYTSTHNPATFATLYHYLVHRLLSGPVTLPALGAEAEMDTNQTNGNTNGIHDADSQSQSHGGRSRAGSTTAQENGIAAGSAKPLTTYPFRVRASVVDRDVVFVPGGWDSIAKIGYLREPFDVSTIQDAWCFDETRYQTIVRTSRKVGTNEQYNELQEPNANNSLLLMYAGLVAAPKQRTGMDGEDSSAIAAATAAAGMANIVTVEDEQVFFAQLFEEQQDQMALEGEDADDSRTSDSTVARMGGSSNKLVSSLLRNLNTAESLLSTASDVTDSNAGNGSDEDEIDSGSAPPISRQLSNAGTATTHRRTDSSDNAVGSLGRVSSRNSRRPQLSQSTTDPVGAPAPLRRKITLPTSAGATSSPVENSATSNEELTSFFQNLLGRKGGASTGSNGKGSPQQPTPRSLNTSNISRNAGQKDVQADLERWKTQLKRQKD
ncbi:hypothetical protein H4S08_000469 [Coemansia sp. RSA 1365]|nr:hypothetical protein H4S08_000469 [Coemansia sp. RSA 1365]